MTTYYKMNEDFLAHYGVLGMKWGVRKSKKSSGGSSTSQSSKKKNVKKALKVGAAVAGTALAVYGSSKLIKNKSMQIQIEKGKKAFDRIYDEHSSEMKAHLFKGNAAKWRETTINTYKKASTAADSYYDAGKNMNTWQSLKNIYKSKKKK